MEYPAEPPAQHGRWEKVMSGAAQRNSKSELGPDAGASLNGNTVAAEHGFRTGRALDRADQLAPPDFHDPSAAYGDMIAEHVLQGAMFGSSSRVHARYSDESAARARQRGPGIAGRSKSMYARTPSQPSRATYISTSTSNEVSGPGGHGGDLAPPQLALAGGGRGAQGGPPTASPLSRPKKVHAAESIAHAHSSHHFSLPASPKMQPPQLNGAGGPASMLAQGAGGPASMLAQGAGGPASMLAQGPSAGRLTAQGHSAGRLTAQGPSAGRLTAQGHSAGRLAEQTRSLSIASQVRHGAIHGLRAGHAHDAVDSAAGPGPGPPAASGDAARGTRAGSGSGSSSGSTSPARLTHHRVRREMSASSLFGALELQLEREREQRVRSGTGGDSQRDPRHTSRALRDNGSRAGQRPALKRPASHGTMTQPSRLQPTSSSVTQTGRILQHQLPAPPLPSTSLGTKQMNRSRRSGGARLEQHSKYDSLVVAASDSSQRLPEGGAGPAEQQQTRVLGASATQQTLSGIRMVAAQNAGQRGAVLLRGRRQEAPRNLTGQTSQQMSSQEPAGHTTPSGSSTGGGPDKSPAAFWAEIQAAQSQKVSWKLDSATTQGRHDGSRTLGLAEPSRQSAPPPPPVIPPRPSNTPAVAQLRQSGSRSKKAPASLRDKATALERAYWKGKLPMPGSGSNGSGGDDPSGGGPMQASASPGEQASESKTSVLVGHEVATGQKGRETAQQTIPKDLDILAGLKPHGTALLEAGSASTRTDRPMKSPSNATDQSQLATGKPDASAAPGRGKTAHSAELQPAVRPTRLPPPPPLPPQLAGTGQETHPAPQVARQGTSASMATHGQSTTGTTSSMGDLVRDITSPDFRSMAAASSPGVPGRAAHGAESSPSSKLAWSPSDSDVLYGLAVPLGMMKRDDELHDAASGADETTASSGQRSEVMHGVEPLSRRSQLPTPPPHPQPKASLQRGPVSDPLMNVERAHSLRVGGAVPAARATARTRPRPRQDIDALDFSGPARDTDLSLSKAATATWIQALPVPRMHQQTQTQNSHSVTGLESMAALSLQASAAPNSKGWDDPPLQRPMQSPGHGTQSERRDSSSSPKSEVQRPMQNPDHGTQSERRDSSSSSKSGVQRAWQAYRRKSMGRGREAGRNSPGSGSIRRIPSRGSSIAGAEAGGDSGGIQSTAAPPPRHPPSPLLQAVLVMEGHSGAASSSSRRSESSRASGSSGSRSSAFRQAGGIMGIDRPDPQRLGPSGRRKSTMGLSRRKSVMRPREQKHRRSVGSSQALGSDHNETQNGRAPEQKFAEGATGTAVEGATGTAAIGAVSGNAMADDGGTGDGMSHRPSDVSLIDAGFIAPSPQLGPIYGSGNGGASTSLEIPSTGDSARHPMEAGESAEDRVSEEWGDLSRVERRVSRVGTELEIELELDASLDDAQDAEEAHGSRERDSSYSQIAAIVSQGGADDRGIPVVPAPNPKRVHGATDGQAKTGTSSSQEDVPDASSPAAAGRIRLHSTASSAGGRTAGTAASLTAGTWHRHDSEGLVEEAMQPGSQAKADMPGISHPQVDVARAPVASNETELTRPRSNPCLRPPYDGTRSPPVPLHAAWPFVPRPLLEHAKKFPQWPQLRRECSGRLVGRRGDGLVVEVDARALEAVFGIGATRPTESGQDVTSSSARPGATGGAKDTRRLVLLHIPLTARPRAPVPVRRMAPRIRLAMIPQAYGKDDDETGFPEDLQDSAVKLSDGRGASGAEAAHTAAGSGSAGEGQAAIGQAEPPLVPRALPSPASSKASSAWNGTPRRMPHSPWRPRDFVGKSSPQPNWKKWDRRLWVHWLDDSKLTDGLG